jgi:FdrA protein
MSIVRNIVKRNFHRDSLRLMRLSEEAKKIDGIKDAAVVMGTPTNREILGKLGLLTEEGREASENDMILAVKAESESQIDEGLRQIEEMVLKPPAAKGGRAFYSFDAALEAFPNSNLALVSVPGEYAREIVLKALDKGLSVHLFSDHVPLEQELELKKYAKEKGLLVMGPGAGTSIIGGKAIAFANVVTKGRTGIVAAAGTGLQEVSVLLSEAGVGVSVGLGTGGGDVKAKIGGLMMIQSIDALEQDPQTDTIVVVSKPPDEAVKEQILNHIATKTKKRYVTCFLGPASYDIPASARNRIRGAKTLHAAFLEATRSIERGSGLAKRFELSPSELIALSNKAAMGLNVKQKYIRGLYTGGTLAYETLIILGRLIGEVYSNAPIDPKFKLGNSYQSLKDSIVDLGEEEFTSGRAHPMIDPTIRKLRLVEEAKDPEVAVIMMDIMLGYGSHVDPAGAMLSAIADAKNVAESDGRKLPMLAHICGTEQDPQPLSEQVAKLQNVGVQVFATNALMAIAGALIARRSIPNTILENTWNDLLRGF